MLKKIILGGVGFLALSFLLCGGAAVGRMRQSVAWVRGQVNDQVPVDLELDRARTLIEETGPQIRECKRVIAERQVEIRELDNQIVELESKQSKSKEKLRVQQTYLEQQQTSYVVGGREVARVNLEGDAARTLERVKTQDQILASKRERAAALEKSLAYAQKTLENVLAQKANLESQLDLLETKLRQTEAMKAAVNNVNLDSTNLAKAKDILAQQSKRLDVVQQMIANDRPVLDEIDVDEVPTADVASEIANYLGGVKTAKTPKAEPLTPEGPATPAIEKK